jgi:hypothetical protein
VTRCALIEERLFIDLRTGRVTPQQTPREGNAQHSKNILTRRLRGESQERQHDVHILTVIVRSVEPAEVRRAGQRYGMDSPGTWEILWSTDFTIAKGAAARAGPGSDAAGRTRAPDPSANGWILGAR